MTLTESERQELVTLNIEKAFQTIKEVNILLANDLFSVAINRIYYGIFYIISALAIKNEFSTSNHSQLIGWFNKSFIKNSKVDRNIGKKIHYAFKQRMKSDYDVQIKFSRLEVEAELEDMKKIIETIHDLIQRS